MSTSGTYKIRPAGRHLLTIGRDLIQNSYAAIVELVKNAYDADSPDVDIKFRAAPDKSSYNIVISDHGHGMSRDTVIKKWMVPSTRDKLNRRVSPSGRTMQGRKGVGRYAASILGADMLLETISPEGEKTTVFVEWSNFESAQFLDDVEILIETTQVSEPSGTRLTMTGNGDLLAEWNKTQFENLQFELKRLLSPLSDSISNEQHSDQLQITLSVEGFPNVHDITETIAPYQIFDLFDYRIAGKIMCDGKGILIYSQQKARNSTDEKIQFDFGKPTECGELVFDIRVYDRDADAIDSLIARGLKDESGNYYGKLKAKQILNSSNGVGVYRNGFRIRPLGDADFDWLKLNEQRVQNPSLRIGSNQAIGYVQIQSEELSGLTEKSARDGLRENAAFDCLKNITQSIIAKLEERRFNYRKNAGLSRPALKVEKEFERLFSFDELKRDIQKKLTKGGVDKNTSEEIIGIISKDAEDKNKVADEIRQAVAIYQGQATLGKIINVILHEGRRPLSYFRNQIPRIRKINASICNTNNPEKLPELISIVDSVGNNAEIFVDLFKRLDPLAAGKRSERKALKLKKELQHCLDIFRNEMELNNVIAKIDCPDDFMFSTWAQDISSIFANLLDNSLYWMKEKNVAIREIYIDVITDRNILLYIDYRDTGPGIEPSLILNEAIFEPQFSTKPLGTGLGLAIAGEAAARNGLELKAFESDTGAYFRLQPKTRRTDE